MADRLLELADGSDTSDRYDNNRTVRTFREQEIQRLQEHRMTEMQLAERGSAAAPAATAMERQRDLVYLQKKEEQHLHCEKELQLVECLSKQLQQEQLHRLEQQILAAAVQRMKEDERREKEMRGELAIELQREKEYAKFDGTRIRALQRLRQARFEKVFHLQYQLHIQQQRIEAERRHNPQLNKDQQQQQIASVQPARAGDHLFQVAEEYQRDLVHLQEKEEQRLHREKELQQLERLSKQQRHQQREEDLQQEELHRLGQQMVAAAGVQRMKEDERREKAMLERRRRARRLANKLQREVEHAELEYMHIRALQRLRRARFEKMFHLQCQLHSQQQRIKAERRHNPQLYKDQQQQRIASVQPPRAGDHLFQGFHHETQQELSFPLARWISDCNMYMSHSTTAI